jgi:hypothetical protein
MEKENIVLYDFGVLIVKSEDGHGFEYLITQSFEAEDGIEEIELLETGKAYSLEDTTKLAVDAVHRLLTP